MTDAAAKKRLCLELVQEDVPQIPTAPLPTVSTVVSPSDDGRDLRNAIRALMQSGNLNQDTLTNLLKEDQFKQ